MKQAILTILMLFLAGCNLGAPGEVPTPLPTPDLPTVEILQPGNNQQVVDGIDFDFDIVARDTTDGISLVELYIDEVLINFAQPVDDETVPVFRATMNWVASGIGLHIVEVIPYRPDGTQGDPARITIEVIAREN